MGCYQSDEVGGRDWMEEVVPGDMTCPGGGGCILPWLPLVYFPLLSVCQGVRLRISLSGFCLETSLETAK